MRHKFALVAIVLAGGLWAQEGPKISTAIIEFDRNNDTADAKKYLQEAADIIKNKDKSEIKDKDLAKFYFYRGKVNYAIANSGKAETRALAPNGIEVAAESLQNLFAYEKKIGKERYSDEARPLMPRIAIAYAQRGIDASAKKDYQGAYEDFILTYNFKKENELGIDTAMLYNAALMAQNAENYEKAIKHTNQLVEMGYRGVQYKATNTANGETIEFQNKAQLDAAIKNGGGLYEQPVVEGDVRPDLMITLANLYKKSGDTTSYDETVSKGRKMFPGNKSLLLLELQKYLDTKEYEKAMVNLQQAQESDPENALYPYLQGYIYQTSMEEIDKAKGKYEEAIAIDSAYLEPRYMMGLVYVDKANKVAAQINELGLNEKSKYDKLKKEQDEYFKKALPHFEKAYKLDSEDLDTMKALKEVYYKLKMYEKAQKIQAEIDSRS